MRRPSYLGLVLVAGAILTLSIIAFRRYLPYTGVPLAPREPPAVVLAMENAYFVGLNHQRKAWSLKAKKVEIGRDRSTTTLTSISDGRIFQNGKVALVVRAGQAVYSSREGDLLLADGVTVEGMDDQKVSAEGAYWNSETATLRSKGRVKFENKWSKATSDDVVVDLKKKEMTMSRVRLSVPMSEIEGMDR